jgi:hypothetical protein
MDRIIKENIDIFINSNQMEQAIMNIEKVVIENLRKLPAEKQYQVLDFTQALKQKNRQDSTTAHEKAEDWWNFLENQPKDTPRLPDEAVTREAIHE